MQTKVDLSGQKTYAKPDTPLKVVMIKLYEQFDSNSDRPAFKEVKNLCWESQMQTKFDISGKRQEEINNILKKMNLL